MPSPRAKSADHPDRPWLRFLRILVILIVFGLVVPRLLGAVTDYIFSGGEPGSPAAAQVATSQAVVTERAVYHGWLSDLILWWQSMQRSRE